MYFYLKDSFTELGNFWRLYSHLHCLNQRSLLLQELFYQLQMTSVGLVQYYKIAILILGNVYCLFIQLKEQLHPSIMRTLSKSQVKFWP